jgi:hypothetical protein
MAADLGGGGGLFGACLFLPSIQRFLVLATLPKIGDCDVFGKSLFDPVRVKIRGDEDGKHRACDRHRRRLLKKLREQT